MYAEILLYIYILLVRALKKIYAIYAHKYDINL